MSEEAKLEGIHRVPCRDGEERSLTKTGKRRMRKATLAELESRWAAVERARDASCEIRKRAGLPPVEPSFWARALRAELEARRPADELAPRRKAKPRKAPAREAKRAQAPDVFRMLKPELIALGTPEAEAELERRQAKRAAKREARAVAA